MLIDIYMPSLDQAYDFEIDDSLKVSEVIDQVSAMFGGSKDNFWLCWVDRQAVLPMDQTLRDLGVYNGSRLMLV